MSFLTKNLNQKITYWAETGTKDVYGNSTWVSPVLLNGRWEDVNDLFVDVDGNEVLSNAKVWLDTDVAVGGYLMNREFVGGETDPSIVVDARRIRKYSKIPNLRATAFERTTFVV